MIWGYEVRLDWGGRVSKLREKARCHVFSLKLSLDKSEDFEDKGGY